MMKGLGALKTILGPNIDRDRERKDLFLSQERCSLKVVERFGMQDAKCLQTPMVQNVSWYENDDIISA